MRELCTSELTKAACSAERGRDGDTIVQLRQALGVATASGDADVAAVLSRVERMALSGLTGNACEVLCGDQKFVASAGGAGAIALERLQRWAECLWASEERLANLRLARGISDEGAPQLALALWASARNLARAGRIEIAAARCEEAVTAWRESAARQPGRFEGRLAETLRLMSAIETRRNNVGQAVAAAAEACRLLRTLDQSGSGLSSDRLASALHNLAGARLAADDIGGAVVAARSAIALRRTLAGEDALLCGIDLARSLSEASVVFARAELQEEAFAAAEEAVDLFRDACEDHDELAGAHRNLAQLAFGIGRWSRGLEAVEHEIGIHRLREHVDGDDAVRALANAFHNRATLLAALQRDQEALTSAEAAIERRRTLSRQTAASVRRDSAASLHLAGVLACRAVGPGSAARHLAEAVNIREALRDGSVQGEEDFAQSCLELSRAQALLGDLESAARSSKEAAEALEAIARKRAGANDFDLYGRALLQTANWQRRAGMREAAIETYKKAALLEKELIGAGLGDGLAKAAAHRLIVCLKRAGRTDEAEVWARRFAFAKPN